MPDKNISLPERNSFISHVDDKATNLYFLKNKNNVQAAISNYGARWVSLLFPDKEGCITDVILGFNSINGYLHSTEAYYGAIVGRYANRIGKGAFSLEEKNYVLAKNNPPNHLHGGIKGFHAVVWDVVHVNDNSIGLQYISADGEEGYPGELKVAIEYSLEDENTMRISFSAVTDKATVVCLTNHAYFNLNGEASGTILNHHLLINANRYTPIDNTSIPFGDIETVENTPFDFRTEKKIGADINTDNQQLVNGHGYDHNFVLNTFDENELAAKVIGDISGIQMEVFTTEPGIQLYTGNFLNDKNILKSGYTDGKQEAFCLETQHFPDSPNHSNFPSVILYPGQTYQSTTSFVFSLKQ